MIISTSSIKSFYQKIKSLVFKKAVGECMIKGVKTSSTSCSVNLATYNTGRVIMCVCGDFNPRSTNASYLYTDWIYVRLYVDGKNINNLVAQGSYAEANQSFLFSQLVTDLGTTTHTFTMNIDVYNNVDFSEGYEAQYAKLLVYEV